MSKQEQRSSFRCTMAIPRPSCELKLGETVLPARLLDESAGGFAVLVSRPPNIETNQLAQLRTPSGWYNIRIVHVTEVTPHLDVGNVAAVEEGPWFRLGILRLGEATQPRQPAISLLAGTLRFQLSQWCPSGGILVTVGIFLMVVLVAVTATVISGSWLARQSHPGPLPSENKSASEWKQSRPTAAAETSEGAEGATKERSLFSSRSSFNDGKSFFGAGSDRQPEASPYSASPGLSLSATVHRLPGATALTLPEVVKRLQLTTSQQEKIQQIIDATAKAMRDLDQLSQGEQRHQIAQRRAELLEQAKRAALELLTKEQLARWNELARMP